MRAPRKSAGEVIASGESPWDTLIDRHLTRQSVERGLSRNSLDAYGGGLRDRAMLEMAYGCGLRVSELVKLQIYQVDAENGCVTVIGKGDKQRVVPVGGAALRALKAYLVARHVAAMARGAVKNRRAAA